MTPILGLFLRSSRTHLLVTSRCFANKSPTFLPPHCALRIKSPFPLCLLRLLTSRLCANSFTRPFSTGQVGLVTLRLYPQNDWLVPFLCHLFYSLSSLSGCVCLYERNTEEKKLFTIFIRAHIRVWKILTQGGAVVMDMGTPAMGSCSWVEKIGLSSKYSLGKWVRNHAEETSGVRGILVKPMEQASC